MILLFVFGTLLYWICEGWNEGDSWKNRLKHGEKDVHKTYHYFGIGERLGIMVTQLYFLFALGWLFFVVHLLGLALYEMVFSWVCYNDPLYNKTSKWLFIKHPPGWFWLLCSITSTLILVFYL
jgi:hypothetical protein